jgi:hypothetical protein
MLKRWIQRVCVFGSKAKEGGEKRKMPNEDKFVSKRRDTETKFDPDHISPTPVPPQADAFKKRELAQEELYIKNREKEQRERDRIQLKNEKQ